MTLDEWYKTRPWTDRIGWQWYKLRRDVRHALRSRRECPGCGHAIRDHDSGEFVANEPGCQVAWSCGPSGPWGPEEFDGCRCHWDGRGRYTEAKARGEDDDD